MITDANVVAWAMRLHWQWIEKSGVMAKDVSAVAYGAVRRARKHSCEERHLYRSTALSIIEFLQMTGPTTICDQL